MSLGRLLAAGKSLIGAHDGAGRYRVNKHLALPKFISPQNPFAPETLSSPAEISSPHRKTKSLVSIAPADMDTAGKNDRQISLGARAVCWLGGWRQKLNPLPRLPKPPGLVKSAGPRFPQPPVQPELSLDKVRVMRNDLSDADFEVVPRLSPLVSRPPQPASPPPEKFDPADKTWNRLTTRIFGVGQT